MVFTPALDRTKAITQSTIPVEAFRSFASSGKLSNRDAKLGENCTETKPVAGLWFVLRIEPE